jgi:hypothetical protein
MDPRYWYGFAPAVVGAAAFLGVASAQAADTTKTQPSMTTPPASTAPAQTTPAAKPARAGEDDAIEFDKLDKNHDGFLDKGEAMMEPRLLSNWANVDTNKDGKISKEEFLNFERARHAKK